MSLITAKNMGMPYACCDATNKRKVRHVPLRQFHDNVRDLLRTRLLSLICTRGIQSAYRVPDIFCNIDAAGRA
jgi:hypothetical protein